MDVFETVTVTISRKEHNELLEKAFAFDAYSKVVTNTIKRGGYVSDMERALFYKEEPVDISTLMRDIGLNIDKEPLEEEGLEEFFSDEEWEKVVELAEEEKE